MPRKKDIGWDHGEPVPGNPNAVKCKYCGNIYAGGGITRFKKHLAGGDGQVEMCTKQGKEVRDMFRALCDKAQNIKNAKAVCGFCEKHIRGGGITRLKEHLAGVGRDVVACTKVSEHVRLRVRQHLDEQAARRLIVGHRGRGRPRRQTSELLRHGQVAAGTSTLLPEFQEEDEATREQRDLDEALKLSTQDPEYLEQEALERALEASRREQTCPSSRASSSRAGPDVCDYDSDSYFDEIFG